MPQCINFKNKDIPFGKGSLHSELQKSSYRTSRRVTKINDGENCRLQLASKILQRHKSYEEERNSRVMGRVRKTLEELEAYKRLLGHSYKTDNLMTLQWGFKPRYVQTPNSFHRYKIETRIYHCGFTKETLHPEVSHMIEMGKPAKRKYDFHQSLLQAARKRSDFLIDRRMTNAAIRKEQLELELEEVRRRAAAQNAAKNNVLRDVTESDAKA